VTFRHPTSDPNRPCTNHDLRLLNDALAHLPLSVWQIHIDAEYGGRGLRELTHGEALSFSGWAVKEWAK